MPIFFAVRKHFVNFAAELGLLYPFVKPARSCLCGVKALAKSMQKALKVKTAFV